MTETSHAERGHAPWSPSASERNWNCPGSLAYCAGVPSSNSEAAARGTVCHEFAERYMPPGNSMPASHIGDVVISGGFRVEVTGEMQAAVNTYIGEVRSMLQPGDELVLEGRIDLAKLGFPVECFGVADTRIYRPSTRTLRVVDAKFGKKAVPAKGNKQLRTYGVGAVLGMRSDQPVDKVITTIVQPAVKRVTDSEEMSLGELVMWTIDLRTAMKASAEARDAMPNMPWPDWAAKYLRAGSHCWFCPRSTECPINALSRAKANDWFQEVV